MSKLNTTAIREMAAAHANEKRRRNEPPGAVLTGTVPGLCDEVDRLRAVVARVEALADRWQAAADWEGNAARIDRAFGEALRAVLDGAE